VRTVEFVGGRPVPLSGLATLNVSECIQSWGIPTVNAHYDACRYIRENEVPVEQKLNEHIHLISIN
jgi:hypothetical protein